MRNAFVTVVLASALAACATERAAESAEGDGIYCKLTTAEMRERLGAIRAGLLAKVVGVDELEAGFRYWVEKSTANIELLAKFVDAESQCCGFFNFEIGLAADAERVSLTLTGVEGTKEFLVSTMDEVSFDWRAARSK